MIDLSSILTVVVAGSTLLSVGGIRGACPGMIAFFGVSAAGIAALTRMNEPLLGSSFGVTLIGAAASAGIAVA
jgi:hypothetical protein